MHDPVRTHEVLSVLAPPKRFELARLLLGGVELSVSRLADAVGLSQSCTTRHLQALERAGLVRGTRDGKRVVFRIEPADPVAAALLTALQGGSGSTRAVAVAPRRAAPVPARPGCLEPAKRARAPRGMAPEPPAAASVPQPEPVTESPAPSESGISSATAARRRSDLEDFLL